MAGALHYDEFGLFHENAEEFGIELDLESAQEMTSVAVAVQMVRVARSPA